MIYEGKALTVRLGEDGIAELTFDLKQESVNKFNELTLTELRQALDALMASNGVQGLLLTSAKEVFVVGADITEFHRWFVMPEEEFVDRLLTIHRTFADIEDLPIPTVALINGLALGGGFEVTLAADYRVMSEQARVGLPEVKLGIFPGWGGTIRLPRLIGLDNAIEWIGTGAEQRAAAALKAGAVDAIVSPADLRGAAIRLLQQCRAGRPDYQARRAEKRAPLGLNEIERTMAFTTAKAYIAQKAGPHYPAPGVALETMAQHATLEREQAARIECEAFARLAKTETAANLSGLFLNDQALKREARRYAETAQDIHRAAVLGAGIMGGGIAYQTALRGVPIVMKDISPEAIAVGLGEAKKLLSKRVERGRMQVAQLADVLNRIDPTLAYEDLAGADLVVEAVVENEGVKKTVLAELEQAVADDTVIASNTSTISISELATALGQPQRFCGMHFFNPVPVMPLVEVIRGARTDEQTVATTVNFARAIGKNPIVVNDCPGFLVNRVLFPYLNGFEMLLRDGADYEHVDRVMEHFGWPMGPAYLLDVVGIDTAHHAAAVLARGFPDRMQLDFESPTARLFVADRYGQKTGAGYYRYEPDRRRKPRKSRDPQASEIVGQVAATSEFSDEEIIERMMVPLCLEAVRCLEDGIVSSAMAVDMGLLWGIGFPPFRGGALRYLDNLGLDRFCAVADRYAVLGRAYEPTPHLRQMAEQGERFFS